MRILAVTDSHPPYHSGGYELRCQAVLDGLASRGHGVCIITTRPPHKRRTARRKEGRVHRVLHRECLSGGLLRGIVRDYRDMAHFDRDFRSFEPDLVYLGHIINLTRAIFPYLADADTPAVIDDGGISAAWSFTHRGPWYGLLGRRSDSAVKNLIKRLVQASGSRLSHGVLRGAWTWPCTMSAFFNSSSSLQYARSMGVPLKYWQVIPSGIDVGQFSFCEHEIRDRRIEIIVPGRMEPVKGAGDAICLLEHLRRKDVWATLTIVGKPSSTAYLSELVGRAESSGLRRLVTIRPQVEHHQMAGHYRRADICFFPSYQAVGLSRVPLEAMASGCVVITYGNEGSDEIIQDGDTGYVVAEGAVEAAAEIIHDLVATPATFSAIARNARRVVERDHSMDRYVDAIEAFLLDVLASGTRPPQAAFLR